MKRFLQEYLENNKVDVPIETRLEDGTTYTSIISYFNYNGDYFNISDINKYIDDIDPKFLYEVNFHGLYHSQKVTFFAYLIGKKLNLNPDDMRILMDAARYHDCGRKSDFEEDLHGLASANRIHEKIHYENPNDMYLLKAIVEAHNHDDCDDQNVFNNWVFEKETAELKTNIPSLPLSFDRFKRLSDILKDADALDRLRFKNCSAVLNEKYLRIDYSKTLVKLSKELNEYYLRREVEESYASESKKHEVGIFDKKLCYHSIGFDFFKLQGILKHGIVSHYNAIMNDIPISRNFNGNNGEFWISVVDADSELPNKKAYETYVKNKISFLCYVDELNEGVDRARENGSLDPRKSPEFPDERFVFDKIPLECIQFLSIPRHLVNKSVMDPEFDYIFCNSQYEMVKLNVENYIVELEKLCDIRINRGKINDIFEDMKKEQYEYNSLSRGEAQIIKKMYLDQMDADKAKLNSIIRYYMQIGFAQLLDKNPDDLITLGEVIDYLLKQYGIEYIPVDELEKVPYNEDDIKFPFMHDDDSYLLRLSTFDLTKNINENNGSAR